MVSIKASDAIAEFLKRHVDTVFAVTGGAAVHLLDSCHKAGLNVVYTHGEQAAGFAAVAYAKVKGFGVCIVSTGPGGTNCLTPCLSAWQDSVPVLFISGQTRAANMSYGTGKRQTASQEAPIVDLVKPITNGATVLTAAMLRTLDASYALAKAGRDGPVWLDVPVDLQWAEV